MHRCCRRLRQYYPLLLFFNCLYSSRLSWSNSWYLLPLINKGAERASYHNLFHRYRLFWKGTTFFPDKFHFIIINLSRGYHRQLFVSLMLPILLTGRVRTFVKSILLLYRKWWGMTIDGIDTSERISWHPNVIIGSVSSSRQYYLWSWYRFTFDVRFRDFNHLWPSAIDTKSKTACRDLSDHRFLVILKLNPVVPISNWKLFHFCSSLGRVSHFDLHPTDEVLLRTQRAAYTRFLSFRRIFEIDTTQTYHCLFVVVIQLENLVRIETDPSSGTIFDWGCLSLETTSWLKPLQY